jgi:hypothetical protein
MRTLPEGYAARGRYYTTSTQPREGPGKFSNGLSDL